MPLTEAARNIAQSYRFQLSLSGSRFSRLIYTSLHWAAYLYAKYLGTAKGDAAQAELYAQKFLGETGLSRRLVEFRTPHESRLRVDLFTSHLIVKELYQDDIYAVGPGKKFAPRAGQVIYDVGAQTGRFHDINGRESRRRESDRP